MGFFITRILFISHFIKVHVAQEENISYVNTPYTWIEATRHCNSLGLVLANNKTDIKNSLQHSNNQNQRVWLGEYKELTDWAYIKGCFNTERDRNNEPATVVEGDKLTVVEGDRLTCQKLCKEHLFFGEKNGTCLCYDDLTVYTTCDCRDSNCFTIWEQNLTNIQTDYDKKKNCIVVTGCKDGTVEKSNENCENDLQTTCDNNDTIEYGLNSQFKSAKKCFERGSFLKWYTNDDCQSGLITQHRWTSGIRDIHRFFIFKNDSIESERLLECFSYDGQKESRHNTEHCKRDKNTFFCREEKNNENSEVTFEQKQSSSVGIVLGVVFIVIGVAVAAVILVIFVKRRTKKMSDDQVQARKSVSVPNFGYNFHVTPNSDIKTHKTDYDYPRVTGINNDKDFTVNYSLAKPIKDQKGDDYSFAQPLDSGGDYAYNSDYDHFNSPVKQSNDSSQYTSADQAVKIYGDKKGTYDHLSSFERKTIDKESCSNSNYDHLPNITGSDPTYDVSGNVIHDDSDKYDHMPTNFKTGRSSSDYQSTRMFPGSVKDNAYDHFELKE